MTEHSTIRFVSNDCDEQAFWFESAAPCWPGQIEFLSVEGANGRELVVRFGSRNGTAYVRIDQESFEDALSDAVEDGDAQTIHVPVITPSDTPRGDAPPKLEERPLPPV